MFGSPNPNPPLIANMQTSGTWLDHFNSDWELMVPYLFVLFFATALALADRGFSTLDPRRIPPLAGIWQWRKTAILVFAALAFALAFIQVTNGFGIERAVRKTVHDQFAKEREEAAGNRAKLATVDYKEDQELARYNLERTSFLLSGVDLQSPRGRDHVDAHRARSPGRQAATATGDAVLIGRPIGTGGFATGRCRLVRLGHGFRWFPWKTSESRVRISRIGAFFLPFDLSPIPVRRWYDLGRIERYRSVAILDASSYLYGCF